MPYSRRTGKKYAAGSTTTYAGWEPRICCLCGGKIIKSHLPALRFHKNDLTGETLSWHVPCEATHGAPRLAA